MTNNPIKTTNKRWRAKQTHETPVLRFSPTAWAKLQFLRDYGETEVGGFAITGTEDLLRVEDVQLVRQRTTWAHVTLDDEAVADFFDRQVDQGRRPQQFARIWVHTHPGDCPLPSLTDEETFQRVFGRADWAIMFILACGGQTYARLRYNVGPGVELELPVGVDYSRPFAGCEIEAWEEEYLANVQPEQVSRVSPPARELGFTPPSPDEPHEEWYQAWFEYAGEEDLEDQLAKENAV